MHNKHEGIDTDTVDGNPQNIILHMPSVFVLRKVDLSYEKTRKNCKLVELNMYPLLTFYIWGIVLTMFVLAFEHNYLIGTSN